MRDESEQCILWYLLLVWVSATDMNRMEQARATLERLQQKQLIRLQDWQADFAVCLLRYILEVTKETLPALSKQILDDDSLANLCKSIGDKLRRAIARQEGLSQQAQTCETQTGEVI